MDNQVDQGFKDHPDLRVCPEAREGTDNPVLPVSLVKYEQYHHLLVNWVHLAKLEYRENLEPMDFAGFQEEQECLGLEETMDPMVSLVLMERMELLENQESMENLDHVTIVRRHEPHQAISYLITLFRLNKTSSNTN